MIKKQTDDTSRHTNLENIHYNTIQPRSGYFAVDWMLGHRINPITEAYFKNDPVKLKSQYMTAVDRLTLEKIKIKTLHTKAYEHLLEKLKKKEEEYQNE